MLRNGFLTAVGTITSHVLKLEAHRDSLIGPRLLELEVNIATFRGLRSVPEQLIGPHDENPVRELSIPDAYEKGCVSTQYFIYNLLSTQTIYTHTYAHILLYPV